jgi:hypothetical protein
LKIFISVSCCALFFAGAIRAQSVLDQFAFKVGGGVTETLSTTHQNLAGGWNAQVGVGYNFTPHLGLMLDVEYDKLRITYTALDLMGTPQGYPGGGARNEAVTLDPVWHFHPKGIWDFYAFGGGGAFQRVTSLSKPVVATATGTDPFFGFNTPGYPSSDFGLVYSVTKPGLDVGFGVSMKVKWNFRLYAEGRYNHTFMGSLGHMDYTPVSVGVRW